VEFFLHKPASKLEPSFFRNLPEFMTYEPISTSIPAQGKLWFWDWTSGTIVDELWMITFVRQKKKP
jgi:hypothetical protein